MTACTAALVCMLHTVASKAAAMLPVNHSKPAYAHLISIKCSQCIHRQAVHVRYVCHGGQKDRHLCTRQEHIVYLCRQSHVPPSSTLAWGSLEAAHKPNQPQ